MLLLLLVGMICFSQTAAQGVVSGLLLWYQAVLPTLFPCCVVTTMLLQRQSMLPLVHFVQPIFRVLFGVSEAGTYVLLCSLCCGYPCAAVLTGQMDASGRLTKQELHHLMAFANVPGPAFLTGFLLKHCFPDSEISGGALVATFLAVAVLLAQISRLLHPQKAATSLPLLVQEHSNTPFFEDLNAAIHQALAIQLQICGCLLFASALSALLSALLTHFFSMADGFFCGILTGILEMTSGIRLLAKSTHTAAFPAACGIAAFGGFSVAAQVFSVMQDRKKTRYSLVEYLVWKIGYGLLVAACAALVQIISRL